MNTTVKLLVPLSTLAVAAAVVVGSGATWTSTTDSTITATAGELIQANTQNGATLLITGLKPGATETGILTIENTGDLEGRLKLQGSSEVGGFAASAVTLTITATDGTIDYPVYSGDFGDVGDVDTDGPGGPDVATNAYVDTWTANFDLQPTEDLVFSFAVAMAAGASHTNQGVTDEVDLKFVMTQTTDDETEQDGWNTPVGTPTGTPGTTP